MGTMVGAPAPDAARRSIRGERARRAARWALLAAITMGAFIGVLSCAASMADGTGHGVHAAAGEPPADHTERGHVRHSTSAAVVDPGSSTRSDAESAAPADTGHPGTACVAPVTLRVPDLFVAGSARGTSVRTAMPPADGGTEPEPPVPRAS